jgi:hypothetical protein
MLRTTRIRTIYRLPEGTAARFGARQIIARELRDAGAETVESARRLLMEVIAERRENQASEPRLTFDVLRARRGLERWSVLDRGMPSWPGRMRAAALDTLADAWGVSRERGLTRTWFERRPRASGTRDTARRPQ